MEENLSSVNEVSADVQPIAPPELGERGEEMVTWEMERDTNLTRETAIGNVMQYVIGNAQGLHGDIPEGFIEKFLKQSEEESKAD